MSDHPSIDERRQERAREYARIRRRLWLGNLVVGVAYLLALLLTGASEELAAQARLALGSSYGVIAVYFLIFFVVYAIVTLPLDVYGGFVLPHRYGLSTQRLFSWVADWLKSNGLSIVMGLVGVEVLYLLLSTSPDWWWLPAAIGLVLFTVLLTNLAPVLLVPIFYKLEPLKDEGLVTRLKALATKARTHVRGVYVMNMSAKTTAANAALMGLGNTRRMVLGDTLLEHFSPDEIESVMAHELGHHVHRDIPKLILVESVTIFVTFYLINVALHWAIPTLGYGSLDNIAAFPILVITAGVLGVLSMPVSNAFSRWVETQADAYAIDITGDPRSFESAMVRLGNQNLAELEPDRWVVLLLYDHPPLGDRIAFAKERARTHQAK